MALLVSTYTAMFLYVSWQKRILKTKNIFPQQEATKGIMAKTGPYSIVVVSLALIHLSIIVLLPNASKDEFFYIAKASPINHKNV